ncbi:MAG: hypothetical protein RLZZ426_54 [Actinomycetota bacterium]
MSFSGFDHEGIGDVYLKSVVTVLIDSVWHDAKHVANILGAPLFMISACNPGVELSAEENARLTQELEDKLTAAGYHWKHAKGKDPDSEYFEPSYLITNIEQQDALTIARDYKQIAIFKIDGASLTVIMCDSERELSKTFK